MIASREPDTEELVRRAAEGDETASHDLLVRHRVRLKRMVAVHLDRRLAARVDPSDVVQDTLAEAAEKLARYLLEQPIPFYPWLRQIALEKVVHLHRRHIRAKARSIRREEVDVGDLPDESAWALADRLLARGGGPSGDAIRRELRERVQTVLASMRPKDREVLVLRYLEQLSTAEIGEVLGLSEDGVKSRQRRALERFSELLGGDPGVSQ